MYEIEIGGATHERPAPVGWQGKGEALAIARGCTPAPNSPQGARSTDKNQ